MANKPIIPYELALIAKEKGFNEPCLAYYRELAGSKEIIFFDGLAKAETNSSLEGKNKMITAPNYQQIADWLKTKDTAFKTSIEEAFKAIEGISKLPAVEKEVEL